MIQKLRTSQLVHRARKEIATARDTVDEAARSGGFRDQLTDVSGLLSCGLVTLHSRNKDIMQLERDSDDRDRGISLRFSPRGIDLESGLSCFVCGAKERHKGANHCLNNITAFVASKEEGYEINGWFPGTPARVDYRESEPDWIQLKVGACDAHLPNLRELHRITSEYGVIRQLDIAGAIAFVQPPKVYGDPTHCPYCGGDKVRSVNTISVRQMTNEVGLSAEGEQMDLEEYQCHGDCEGRSFWV